SVHGLLGIRRNEQYSTARSIPDVTLPATRRKSSGCLFSLVVSNCFRQPLGCRNGSSALFRSFDRASLTICRASDEDAFLLCSSQTCGDYTGQSRGQGADQNQWESPPRENVHSHRISEM